MFGVVGRAFVYVVPRIVPAEYAIVTRFLLQVVPSDGNHDRVWTLRVGIHRPVYIVYYALEPLYTWNLGISILEETPAHV